MYIIKEIIMFIYYMYVYIYYIYVINRLTAIFFN